MYIGLFTYECHLIFGQQTRQWLRRSIGREEVWHACCSSDVFCSLFQSDCDEKICSAGHTWLEDDHYHWYCCAALILILINRMVIVLCRLVFVINQKGCLRQRKKMAAGRSSTEVSEPLPSRVLQLIWSHCSSVQSVYYLRRISLFRVMWRWDQIRDENLTDRVHWSWGSARISFENDRLPHSFFKSNRQWSSQYSWCPIDFREAISMRGVLLARSGTSLSLVFAFSRA